jgi:hypothetical protein
MRWECKTYLSRSPRVVVAVQALYRPDNLGMKPISNPCSGVANVKSRDKIKSYKKSRW